jgi:hypothetical protein
MKLRASYGTLGNDQIPNNGYVSQLSGEATYVLMVLWLTGTVKYKSNLKWEQAQKFDLGLDLKLFNNKVSIVTDYFTDTRKDLLIQTFLFQDYWKLCSGASAPTVNAGTVKS